MAKILWASNETYFERPLIDSLEAEGHEVIITQTTKDFLAKKAGKKQYDLVITNTTLEI